MTFLHPAILLAGVLAVAIPIVIHFFMRRRRRPIPWAAMRFLMEAYRKRRRRLTLEQLLLLAARCALLALLGAALARPLIGAGALTGDNPRLLVVLVDNSLTARVRHGDGSTGLERNLAIAARAVEALDPARGDRAAVISLGAPAAAVVADPSADLASVGRAIASIRATDARADLAGAADLARAVLDAAPDAEALVVVASDLLAGSADTDRALPEIAGFERTARVLAPDPAPAIANTSVAALDPARRVLTADEAGGRFVRVQLRRFGAAGEGRSEVTLIDERDARPLGSGQVAWSAGELDRTVSIPFAPDALAAAGAPVSIRAEISSDALGADDVRHASIEPRRSIRVGVVARSRVGSAAGLARFTPADWVRLSLAPDESGGAIEPVPIDPVALDAPRLAALDACIIVDPDALAEGAWSRLGAFARDGGPVIVAPPAGAEAHLWADAFIGAFALPWAIDRQAADLDPPAPIDPKSVPADGSLALIAPEMPDLARPVSVSRLLRIRHETPGETLVGVELRLEGGAPLIITDDSGRAPVTLIATAIDLSWTDLPAKPLLVPMMQELVRRAVGRSRAALEHDAGDRVLAPARTTELVPIADQDRAGAIPVDNAGRTASPVRTAGVYRAIDDSGSARGLVVVNPDAGASDTNARTRAELEPWLATLAPGGSVEWIERAPGAADQDDAAAVAAAIGSRDDRRPIAPWVLAAACAVALVELGLARTGSHAERSEGA
ncbi:MAG: BatA domain-containing protein [Phycisphaerales bacterium]